MRRRRSPGGGPAGIKCARCDALAASIRVDDLTGGTGAPSGENMPTIVIPPIIPPNAIPFGPDVWIADPDGEGLVCDRCATTEEIAAFMEDGATVERAIEQMYLEETGELPEDDFFDERDELDE